MWGVIETLLNMTRLYQDTDFIVSGLNGSMVHELIGLVDQSNPDTVPIVVTLKTEKKSWFRFFLSAGLAFWEEWEAIDDDTDDETRLVDYADMYSVRNKVITAITCIDSTMRIQLDGNMNFILRFIDEHDIDSDSEVFVNKI